MSASSTRNWCLDDPLLDWLKRYGQERGFVPDTQAEGFDERCDFTAFILSKGQAFEDAALTFLGTLYGLEQIAEGPGDSRSKDCVKATWAAMAAGREIIAQGVLWNPENHTYGMPDLLVRSDVLRVLFPSELSKEEASHRALDLPQAKGWHYRVVDIKFTTLKLLKDGHGGSKNLAYHAQVWLYNQALGRIQGHTPSAAYLLGRGWEQGRNERGDSAMDRLERVDHNCFMRNRKKSLEQIVTEACCWQRRLRAEGGQWEVLPEPSNKRLRPNLTNKEDFPWHGAKGIIGETQEDLTKVYYVGPDKRNAALEAGVKRWSDPACNAESLGLGEKAGLLADAILAANRCGPNAPAVFSAQITASEKQWRKPVAAEFYIDFETVSNIDDDFSQFPNKGGTPLIFMVGVGWLEDPSTVDSWQFRVFTADKLDERHEGLILGEWVNFMREKAEEAGSRLEDSRLFHWSNAELSFLVKSYNSAAIRHGVPQWNHLPWVDLMQQVVKEEPVTVRGAWGFGLKAITKAMHAAGLIQTDWKDGPADGLGAMAGAWWCGKEAEAREVSMKSLGLMKEIEAYNEVDCKAMADILTYLRINH